MSGKVKFYSLSELEKKKYLGEFYDMVSLLGSRDEVKRFFKDLLTLSEVVMISRRIQVAKKLLSGDSYIEIINDLKVGCATVSQVERWLRNGFGGYKEIIKKHNKKTKLANEVLYPGSLKNLRKRYPGHYLLLNLLNKK